MRAAGLSARKVEYLCDLAEHFESGTVHVGQWRDMDDEAIIEELVGIRGIGRWTAEMFLIFHLMRPNVLPLDDIGLHQGHQRQLLQRRAGRRGPKRARWATPGRLSARSRLGTFGAASTRCRSDY